MKKRPVDFAMYSTRPEKTRVRNLWIAEIKKYISASDQNKRCLYLTLPGAAGLDIQLLIDQNILDTTENGSIVYSDFHKVVAIESSPSAVLQLQRKFPGLKILESSLEDHLRGTGLKSWPTTEQQKDFEALVINLDLNSIFEEDKNGDSKIINVITKIAHIHNNGANKCNWSLLLTLHGEVRWDNDVWRNVTDFLNDNFETEPKFKSDCEIFLGQPLFKNMANQKLQVLKNLSSEDQQKILMVYVPKKIVSETHKQGWKISTVNNLRYGGKLSSAPMVSWIFQFEWDKKAKTTPLKFYKEMLQGILKNTGTA